MLERGAASLVDLCTEAGALVLERGAAFLVDL
jgi:hypothetical protein